MIDYLKTNDFITSNDGPVLVLHSRVSLWCYIVSLLDNVTAEWWVTFALVLFVVSDSTISYPVCPDIMWTWETSPVQTNMRAVTKHSRTGSAGEYKYANDNNNNNNNCREDSMNNWTTSHRWSSQKASVINFYKLKLHTE